MPKELSDLVMENNDDLIKHQKAALLVRNQGSILLPVRTNSMSNNNHKQLLKNNYIF